MDSSLTSKTENESKNAKNNAKRNEKVYLNAIIGVTVLVIILMIVSVGLTILADHEAAQQVPLIAPAPRFEKQIAEDVDTTTIGTSSTTDKETCRTRKCIDLATRLTENMNPDVKPCDDFYEHACGRFSRNYLTENRKAYNAMTRRYNNLMMKRIEHILSSTEPHNSSAVEFVKKFYKSCKAQPKNSTIKPLFDYASKLFGGFPLLDPNWTDNNFDINNALSIVLNEQVDALLTLYKPSRLGGERFELRPILPKTDNDTIESIEKILKDVISSDKISEYTDQYRSFAKKYDNATDEMWEWNKYELSMDEMDRLVPSIKWSEIIKSTFPSDVKYDPLDYVIAFMLAAPKNVSLFEKFLNDTPKAELANLFVISYVMKKAGYLYKAKYEFDCVKQAAVLFPRISLLLYMDKYYDRRGISMGYQMFDNIRDSFRDMLNTSEYLDRNTTRNLIKKLDSMNFKVPVPDQDYQEIDDEVRMLNIEGKDHFEKVTEIEKWRTKLINDMGTKKPNVEHLQKTHVTNAYYFKNNIAIYLAFLDYPFFDVDAPDFLNYGSSGTVLGHEMGHGFDNYNKDFNETMGRDKDYWGVKTKEEYARRAQCLVDQFDEYEWEGFGVKVNGSLTLRENQADEMGMEATFRAYKKLNPTNEVLKIPGLEQFTGDQLFFYSNALTWCGRPAVESYLKMFETDVHAFAKFRVHGIRNQPAFAKAFNCASGTFMNPVEKCITF